MAMVPCAASAKPAGDITMETCDEVNATFQVPTRDIEPHLPSGWHDRYRYSPATASTAHDPTAWVHVFSARCTGVVIGGVRSGSVVRTQSFVVVDQVLVDGRPVGPAPVTSSCCNLYLLEWATDSAAWVGWLRTGPYPVPRTYADIRHVPDLQWGLTAPAGARPGAFSLQAPAPTPSPFQERGELAAPFLVDSDAFSDADNVMVAIWIDSPRGPLKIGITNALVSIGSATGALRPRAGTTLGALLGCTRDPCAPVPFSSGATTWSQDVGAVHYAKAAVS